MNKQQQKKLLELKIDGDLVDIARDPYRFILKEFVRFLNLSDLSVGSSGMYKIVLIHFPKKYLANKIK